jgi:ribosomal protein S18 acetylase RimI-like enzyme
MLAADADELGQLWESLVRYHRALDDRLPEVGGGGSEAYVRRLVDQIGDTHTQVFVAEANGNVVGFVFGLIVDLLPEMFVQETGGFLADIYVDESVRRQGVGRRLVAALVNWFRSRGVSYLELYVASRNEAGQRFWESIGASDLMIRMRADLKGDLPL